MIIPMPPLGPASDRAAVAPLARSLVLRREAIALSRSGQFEAAERAWRDVLHGASDDAEAAHELGEVLAALGRHGDAAASFERALHYAPEARRSKLALGRAVLASGRPADARHVFEDMLVRDPQDTEALTSQAASLRALGRQEAALDVADRALRLTPQSVEAGLEKARSLADLKRPGEAIDLLEALHTQHGDHLEATLLLARLHQEAKNHGRAAELFRKVVAAKPGDADTWQTLACALRSIGAWGESVEAFRRAVTLKPVFAVAYANMALVLADLGRLDEAVQSIDRALSIEPDSRNSRFIKGCIHLSRGEFTPGWEGYEHRFSKDGQKGMREDVHAAPWCGEPLAGRSILVLGEQANGDYFQFTRYLPALAAMGARVSFFVPGRLKRLFSGLSAEVELLDGLHGSLRFDYQCHLMSLPHRFHLLGQAVPTEPWLHAEPELRETWRGRIGPNGFKVGVAWQGSNNDARSFSAHHLQALAAVPGVRLIGLHQQDAAKLPPDLAVETLGEGFDSGDDGFIDAAAAIAAMDLIVSCDTSLAHLAGALGQPTWIALNIAPEWRWQRGTSQTPWYPRARLFRQRTYQDWDQVFRDMAQGLMETTA